MDNRLIARLIGAALLVPVAIAWLLALVVPTIRLISMSLHSHSPLRRKEPEFVGFDNYDRVFEDGVAGSVLFGVSLAILPLIVFFLTGPLLGWAASHAGSATRRIVRVALALPLACFVPLAAGYAWTMRDAPQRFPDPAQFPNPLRVAVLIGSFGLISALGFTIYASVFRSAGRPRWLAALGVSGVAALAGIAYGVQQFGINVLNSGVRDDSKSPEIMMFTQIFGRLNYGPAAAILTVEFAVLALLGLLATGVIILTGLRFRVLPRDAAEHTANPAAKAGLIAGAVLILGLAVLFLLPWLGGLGNPLSERTEIDYVGTWIPPLLTTIIALILAVLGGFGIGALRPLGRFSELLLIPFAPWLFVGSGPFSLPAFENARASGDLDSFTALIPPLWVVIPALFVFTLFFRGQADTLTPDAVRPRTSAPQTAAPGTPAAWAEPGIPAALVEPGIPAAGPPVPGTPPWAGVPAVLAPGIAAPGSFVRTYLLPALPLLAITGSVLWLIQAQDVLWSMVMTGARENPTSPAAFIENVINAGYRSTWNDIPYSVLTPLWLIPLVVIGAVAAQWFYAERVVITTSR